MASSTSRAQVVDLLNAATPAGVTVIPYAKGLEVVAGDTVMVSVEEVVPSVVPNAAWQFTFALLCLVPQTTAGPADDELDDLLEVVLNALESSAIPNNVVWTKATRATYDEKFPAYRVDLTVHMSKE